MAYKQGRVDECYGDRGGPRQGRESRVAGGVIITGQGVSARVGECYGDMGGPRQGRGLKGRGLRPGLVAGTWARSRPFALHAFADDYISV